jgi:hypothetical protein
MNKTILTATVGATLVATITAALEFTAVANWTRLPPDRAQIGNMHGDVAVSAAGEVYVSVQDPQGGIQVYAENGTFLRSIASAPPDFHGFVIRRQSDGEFLYGARMRGQEALNSTGSRR